MKSKLVYSKSSFVVSWPLIVGLFVLGILSFFWNLYFLAGALLLVFFIALIARLWGEMSSRKVKIVVSSDASGLFPGETTEFEIEIENEKMLPVLWMEAYFPLAKNLCIVPEDTREPEEWEKNELKDLDLSQSKVGDLRFSSFLWYEKQKAKTVWKAERRGIYSTENWKIRSGDGFGLAQIEQPIRKEDVRMIAVYPEMIEVKKELFLRNSWDAVTGEHGNLEDNTIIRSTREYTTSDNIKNINWRLLARNLPLSVNVYEEIMPQSAFFIIDGESFSGKEKHLEELEETLSIVGSEIVALKSAGVQCALAISEGCNYKKETIGFDSELERLLWALSEYNPLPDLKNDAEEIIDQKSVFDREGMLEEESRAGKFYYVTFDTEKLEKDSVLYELGPEKAVVLKYNGDKPFGEYTTVSILALKGEA